MDKRISVFGASHTYGDGLPDCGHEKPWEEHSQLTWPYHMFAPKLIKNFSYPGCSNDIIALKLLRHAKKNDRVLIMFGPPQRFHICREGTNLVINHNTTVSIADNGQENWVAKQVAEKFDRKNVRLFVENFDDDFLEINFLKNILLCQFFCKSNNIEHYFTFDKFPEQTKAVASTEKYITALRKNIDWENVFLIDGTHGFGDYAKKIKAEHSKDASHFNEAYHKLFGKLFLDWINKKKVL